VESHASQSERTLTIDWMATSLSITGDTYKDPITEMEYVFVRGGCYRMGNKNADAEAGEKPTHKVCVDDFYMSKYEVTQAQWTAIMWNNPSEDKGNAYPVNNVSWEDAHTYALKIKHKTGVNFRLPTEAEWEYAARSGGKDEKWPGTNHEPELGDYAWYKNLSIAGDRRVKSVGLKKPNGLGLYDMAGNVKEWVSDWRGPDYFNSSPRNNPQGPSTGMEKVIRGGSYDSFPSDSGTTHRDARASMEKYNDVGFRLVIEAPGNKLREASIPKVK
jgi:sulfatase modifying factor 1